MSTIDEKDEAKTSPTMTTLPLGEADVDNGDDNATTQRISLAEDDDAKCDAEELAMRIEIRRQMDAERKGPKVNDTQPNDEAE